MVVKNFILDTNILLHDPRTIYAFADNVVNVPIVVMEEVDTFKKDASELGRNAREVTREIDALRNRGSLVEGVPLESGGRLRVVLTDRELPTAVAISPKADNRIIATALHLKETEPERPAIFVTLDVNLRIRANALGLLAVDYQSEPRSLDEIYSGVPELEMEPGFVSKFYEEGSAPLPEGARNNGWHENEYIQVRDGKGSALARVEKEEARITATLPFREPVWGIRPRNREQHFALDACLRDEIALVTLVGKAGTGKTLLAAAAGLQKVTEDAAYQKLLVSRPIFPMGRDIGFLPGEIEQKLKPWMQPIHDNVELLCTLQRRERRGRGVSDLVGRGVMEIEPLTYIRGRSIPNQYMVIDEAQNLTPHEVKTILTRAGDGTKVVFTGDPYQIDNPYVDSVSNGLTYLVERFKDEPIAASVILTKGERSQLAEIASNLL